MDANLHLPHSIFLIGPSGVGKTNLATETSEMLPGLRVINVDEEVRIQDPSLMSGRDWEAFWNVASARMVYQENQLNEFEFQLFDVGAGCLQSKSSLEFFRCRNTVLIYDSPKNTFNKVNSRPESAWINKTLEQHIQTEFSDERKKIYKACRKCIDVGKCTKKEAADMLLQIIQELKS